MLFFHECFFSLQEEGEVLSGRILAYGAAMRSKIFSSGAIELQQAVISEMLSKSKERSYLPLLTYTFITEFIKTVRLVFELYMQFGDYYC